MPAIPVKTQTATPQAIPDTSEYIATLQSRGSSIIQPDVEGQVNKVLAHSGEHVKAGALLFLIDPVRQEATINSQEANRKAKQANLDLARKELERRKNLAAAGVISKQELDQAQSAFDAAQGDLDSVEAIVREQKVALGYYTIVAPAAGVVGDIPVRVGDRITKTTTLTTLDSETELEAYINIPAEKAPDVHEGSKVEILGPDGKPQSAITVSYISPRVDPANQLLLVKAFVPNSGNHYKNQEQVRVALQWSTRPHPLVPILAVSRLGGQFFAFVAEPNGAGYVARQRAVQLGQVVGNDYIVLDGIKPGEKIIVSGTQMLQDGAAVVPQT